MIRLIALSLAAANLMALAGCASAPIEPPQPLIAPKQINTVQVVNKVVLPMVPMKEEAAANAAPAPAAKKTWEVRVSDGTVYGTLKRWSKDAGMQLMWETENHDLRLRGQATYTADFDVAVYELMKSVEHSDYPLRACIYDNGAVRIVHTKKSCKG